MLSPVGTTELKSIHSAVPRGLNPFCTYTLALKCRAKFSASLRDAILFETGELLLNAKSMRH
jgi:hypothetical protein